jgi:two-component system chemotaxis sensor kinase CheA
MIDDEEALQAFLEEAREHLGTLEQHLVALDAAGASGGAGAAAPPETINSIFRAAHTIKGTAGFFGLDRIKDVAHAAENVLGDLRSGDLAITPEVVTALLAATDALGQMIADVHHTEAVDCGPALARLAALRPGAKPVAPPKVAAPPPAPTPPPPPSAPRAPEALRALVPGAPDGHTPPAAILAAPLAPSIAPSASIAPRAANGGTLRVGLGQLDRLMMLAGELVLTRNALVKKASERSLEGMIELAQRVDAITSDLQDGIMATRMQPVGIVFTKFRKIVRGLALELGKRIELEIEGEEVELDKTIVEAIGDPLTHLVRNSADHGIESPAARRAAGKNEAGRLRMRAFHEAGQVVIEVSDDGGGIDPDRVASRALARGLRTRAELDAMSDGEKIRLVFEPGFSTAEVVTDVSGRGVGMDVVLSTFAKVGGTVDLRSEVRRGTTTIVRLPLTLAIIPSILVAVGNERFAIPQVNVAELVRIPAGEVKRRIERVGTAPVLRLRGELLPLLALADALDIPRDGAAAERRAPFYDRREVDAPADDDRRSGEDRRAAASRPLYVAVVTSGGFRYGLVVDQLLDSEEIVVKPLGAHFPQGREYAGATILGDGTVALILDVAGLSVAARLTSQKGLIDAARASSTRKAVAGSDTHTFLVVENGPGEHFAVPLGTVSRIERVRPSAIVSAGGRRTLTHGGAMLPLLAIEDAARVAPRAEGRAPYVLVCRVFGREVAVLVSSIVDVVDSPAEIDHATHVQPGILGSAVIDDQVMLLLDVHGLVEALLPEYKRPPKASTAARAAVLVVEDSPFFRHQIVSALEGAGFRTMEAEDGAQGFATLEQHPGDVGLVVTDIEMPRMDGLELTRRIRGASRFADVPVVAVTSLAGEVAEQRGRDAGLDEYLVKFDREQLVERTQHYLAAGRDAGRAHAPSKGAHR